MLCRACARRLYLFYTFYIIVQKKKTRFTFFLRTFILEITDSLQNISFKKVSNEKWLHNHFSDKKIQTHNEGTSVLLQKKEREKKANVTVKVSRRRNVTHCSRLLFNAFAQNCLNIYIYIIINIEIIVGGHWRTSCCLGVTANVHSADGNMSTTLFSQPWASWLV